MKLKDKFVSKEQCFSVGIEEDSGRYYLSIPVSNGIVDYEEYYEISKADSDLFQMNPPAALIILDLCRSRKNDKNLMILPGKNRGVAV